MPGLRTVLESPNVLDDSADAPAEGVRLYLPSELSSSKRDRACIHGICDVEAQVRHADVSEALNDLRRNLQTRTYLNKWRVKNISGQHKLTRTWALQHRVDVRVHAAKTRYRHSQKALLILQGHGQSEESLKELRDEDVRALNERTLSMHEKQEREHRIATGRETVDDCRDRVVVTGALGKGKRTLSWIWLMVNGTDDSLEMHEGLSHYM
jgi:hypothetical protein